EEFRAGDQHHMSLCQMRGKSRSAEAHLAGVDHHLYGVAPMRRDCSEAGSAWTARAQLRMIHDVEQDTVTGGKRLLDGGEHELVHFRRGAQPPGIAQGKRYSGDTLGEARDRQSLLDRRALRREAVEMAA